MRAAFFLAFCLLAFSGISQVSNKEIDSKGKKYFQTIVAISNYLKVHKTIPLAFHESVSYSNEEAFYDTVITKFFSKEKMLKIFEMDTSHLAVAGKLDWLRHTLNEVDYYLDIIPSDSIFIRSHESSEIQNSLEVYLIVNNKEVPVFKFHFDSQNAQLISMSTILIQENNAFMSYLKRQKNYYEFPDPFNKN